MICTRCHRPLKHPTDTGMGRVCAAKAGAAAVPAHHRDLFGYDLDKAFDAALFQVRLCVDVSAAAARMAIKRDFAAARVRLLGWAAR